MRVITEAEAEHRPDPDCRSFRGWLSAEISPPPGGRWPSWTPRSLEYRLFALNAQPGMPDRPGVTLETPFVGAGMRRRKELRYFPCRLSLVPHLLTDALPPDVVVVHTSMPANGTVSLGVEVNVLPAAIEAVRARGGLVIAQLNSAHALHLRRRECWTPARSTTRSRWTSRCPCRPSGPSPTYRGPSASMLPP